MKIDLTAPAYTVPNTYIIDHLMGLMVPSAIEYWLAQNNPSVDILFDKLAEWLTSQGIPANHIISVDDAGEQQNIFEIEENEKLTLLLLKEV